MRPLNSAFILSLKLLFVVLVQCLLFLVFKNNIASLKLYVNLCYQFLVTVPMTCAADLLTRYTLVKKILISMVFYLVKLSFIKLKHYVKCEIKEVQTASESLLAITLSTCYGKS